MTNLFRGIVISRNFHEDLATDALQYLLQRTPWAIRKKLRDGFASLWSSYRDFDITSYQPRISGDTSGGRPDLTGYVASEQSSRGRPMLAVEIKFAAQPTPAQCELRYLADLDPGGVLLFIVPDERRNAFQTMVERAELPSGRAKAVGADPSGPFWLQPPGDSGIIGVVGWKAVIDALEKAITSRDPATPNEAQVKAELADLRWFCERKGAMEYFAPLPSTEEMAKRETAGFLMSIITLIDGAVSKAREENVIASHRRYDDEPNGRSYGYEIAFGREDDNPIGGWFGLYLDAWQHYGKSPVWLQFEGEVADRVTCRLGELGEESPYNETEWLLAVPPKPGASEAATIDGLVADLKKVKSALRDAGLVKEAQLAP